MSESAIALGTAQVAELAGVSRRTAQVWDERGLVRPWRGKRGEQVVRAYGQREALAVMVLADLRARRLGVGQLKVAAAALERGRPDLETAEFLIFDGRMFYCRNGADAAIALVAALPAPMWLVAMEDKQRRVRLASAGREMAADERE